MDRGSRCGSQQQPFHPLTCSSLPIPHLQHSGTKRQTRHLKASSACSAGGLHTEVLATIHNLTELIPAGRTQGGR